MNLTIWGASARNTVLLVAALLLSSASCAQQNENQSTKQAESPATQPENPMITLKTNLGEIKIQLDAEKAPVTTANFISYVKSGHYDGTVFHRVIKEFMIQGGGFEAGMKQKSVNQPIPNEADNGLDNDEYTIAMARTGDPHSATAQFFINTNDNRSLNHSSKTGSGWGYAVFGKVVEGFDVVDAIKNSETSARAGHGDVPDEDVVIETATVEE